MQDLRKEEPQAQIEPVAENLEEPTDEGNGFFHLAQDLPLALTRLVVRLILMGLLFMLVGVGLAVYLHTVKPLIFLLVSFWSLVRVFSVVHGWHNGKIQEKAVVCISVDWMAFQKKSNVVFRSSDEKNPGYIQFYVPEHSRQRTAFSPGRVYVIYTHVNTPDVLLAWFALGNID